MYDPAQILAWLVANVLQMRHSRRKTLSAIVGAGLLMKGVGVLCDGGACGSQTPYKAGLAFPAQ